jgi:hypothetical protein
MSQPPCQPVTAGFGQKTTLFASIEPHCFVNWEEISFPL